MTWISLGVALISALAIIWIGFRYLVAPRAMAPSLGLPLPEEGANTTSWLRLKGVRDIASGLVVLGLMAWESHRALGIALLLLALIPLGDMSVVLYAKGKTSSALGIHGVTALLMIAAAIPLISGA